MPAKFVQRVLGVPLTKNAKRAMHENISSGRSPEQILDFLFEAVQLNTHKAGALLGAQGIFVIVSTYALDHGWPKSAAIAAILLLLAGSLLILTVLKSTSNALMADPEEQGWLVLNLLNTRTVRYNIALYLTFVSIFLLAAGTFTVLR